MDVIGAGPTGIGRLSGILLVIAHLAVFPALGDDGSSVSLYKKYLEADQKAIESESKGDRLAALENYRNARGWLARIGAVHPDWFPDIVGYRMAECGSHIDRLGGEIEMGEGGDMQISREIAAEAIGRKEVDTDSIYSGMVEEICSKADDLYEGGYYADAAREYELILKLDPDHPRANFQLGLIYSENIRDRAKMEKYWGRYRAVSHFEIGDISCKDERYLTAIEQYKEALRISPDNNSIRRRLAGVYFEQKRYPEAVRVYQALVSGDPGDMDSRFQLARIHAEMGAVEKAISELDFIRKRAGDFPGLVELYAELKVRAGDPGIARAFYEKAIDKGTADPGPYLGLARLSKDGHDPAGAMEVLALGLSRFPDSDILAREMGRCCVDVGEYGRARVIYEGLLEKSPDDVDVIVGLGVVSFEGNDRERAEAYFKKALEIEPASAHAFFHLASCRESSGDIKGAGGFLEKAVENGINKPEAYVKLVDLYMISGETDKAISSLKDALRRWPDALDMRKKLISLYMGGGRRDAAIEELKEYVGREGRDASAFLQLGDLCRESGKEEEALPAYSEALRLDAGIKGLSEKIGVLHQRRGEYAPAVKAYLKAVEENPDSAVLHNNIAVCRAKSYMFREAIEEYEKALALDSDFAEAHIDLAKIYGEKLGEPEKAIEHCCRYLELRPDGEQASLVKEMMMLQRETKGE